MKPSAETLHPDDIGTLVALVNQQRSSEAEKRTRALLEAHPNSGVLWKILGVTLLRQGKEALPALRRTAELMPLDAEAHGNLGAALHDRGLWAEALVSLRRALEIRPDDTQGLTDAANALRQIGRSQESIALYERVLRIEPRSLEALNDLGNALVEVGRHEEALRRYRLALDIKPDNAKVHSNLGNALRQLGRLHEADISSRRAIALDPALTVAHNNLGVILAALGRPEEAAASYRQALVLNANYVEAHINLGNALRDMGDIRLAIGCFHRAIELEPKCTAAHRDLGNALLDFGLLGPAAASYARALALRPDHAACRLTLSMVMRRQGRAADAEASCRAALAIEPDSPEALSFLGELCADRGAFSEAERLFWRALAIDAECPNAWCGIVTHRKMTIEDTAWLDGAQRLAAKPLPLRHAIGLRYALGKYFDDIGQFEQAFGSYRQANELTKRHASTYDRARFTRRIDEVVESFDPAWIRECRVRADRSECPVFIVGMPRSGTSLIEQILASHPAVFGAGELTFWGTAFTSYRAAGIRDSAGARLIPNMADNYLKLLTELSGGALRVVDKMPANFMNLGLIHCAFPNARIIHVRRNPIDTCLSVYFQNFPNSHPYANDLDDLAYYYGEYVRIMNHWRDSLPAAALLEISYEALVGNQESWTRRMLDFVGLPWDPKCLDFHETGRVVITSSKWQVRQKIHAASVGRRRNYEKFSGPLQRLALLE